MELLYLFGGVVIVGIIDTSKTIVNQIHVQQLKHSLGNNEDDVWRNIGVSWLKAQSIHTALKYAKQLHFLKVLLLSTAGFDLVNQLDPWVLIYGVDFKKIGANTAVLFRPELSKPENIFTIVILIPASQFFKAIVILFAISEALLS